MLFAINVKKELNSEPFCNKKFLKTKIKAYDDDATDFHDREMPKVESDYTCSAVITVDSALKKN